jgi:hypothetical protein
MAAKVARRAGKSCSGLKLVVFGVPPNHPLFGKKRSEIYVFLKRKGLSIGQH